MIIYITTPTSGSQSIYRILHEYAAALGEEIKMFRGSDLNNFEDVDPSAKYVVNFRDPRDMWCNQYHWLVQHDAPNEKVAADRKVRYDKGIDFSVRQSMNRFVANRDPAAQVVTDIITQKIKIPNLLFVSYAQLCMSYEEMVSRLNNYFSIDLNVTNNLVVKKESPTSLAENTNWIGNVWNGCDIKPGRFKRELKEETIKDVTAATLDYNELLKTVELEPLRYLYD